MAELALGLTKTVVEGALSRIQWAIEEEGKLKEGVQQDLEFITGEFQMMQSFLKVANKERARKNEVVRTWVRQLRDLAFDVEDWVEFVAHLDKDESLCSCWWRLVPSWAVPRCMALPRHLDEAAAEMKLLKARVHDVSQRNTRYNLFNSDDSGSGSGLDSKTVMPTIADLSSTAFQILRQVWRDETYRLRQVDSLTNLITSQAEGVDLEVIWLWGADYRSAPDHIHMAYQDPEICRSFDCRAWVKISHPFNLQVFLGTLVAQLLFVGFSHQQATNNGLTSTAELIQQVTKEQRYLVVLEDVSDLVEWNTIRTYLPNNKMGSRIVVATQNMRHAILCTRVPYLVSELGWFADGRPSFCAFYKKVTGRSDSAMDILIGKIKLGGVISVYGEGPRKSSVVKRSYLSIQQNPEILDDGKRSRWLRWVPVVDGRRPFMVDFLSRMLLALDAYGFYDGGLQELFDIIGGRRLEYVLCTATEEKLTENSRKLLRRFKNRLVVIDGLRSTEQWDELVKSGTIFLPDDEPTKCCVVVVTHDQSVARYCVDGNEDRLVRVSEQVHLGMRQRPILTCRREMAITWMSNISDPHLTERRLFYDDLINDCIRARSHPVASVWGIAGVGKSTLVNWFRTKKMFDPDDKYKFHCCWVDVPHPFSLAELSLHLFRAFFWNYLSLPKERAMIAILEGDRDPIQECRLLLRRNERWLLVLDGLRSTDDWDTINEAFSLSKKCYPGCKTIVITNEQSVAKHCVDKRDKQVINVQGLHADEALNHFNEKIQNNNQADSELSKLSESIIAKSGGLPKVIAAVVDYYNVSSYNGAYMKLKDINDNFMHILEGSDSLIGLFSWMKSYMETCNDDLKPCIFYLPVFPIDHDIRFTRLMWRFKAEGYIRDTSREKNTERLFTELLEFSMIQSQRSSKPYTCRLNGFLHEYITSRPMEDNLVFALDGPCSMRSHREGGQHLTIGYNWDRDINVFGSTDFSRLRSLTIFGRWESFMFDPAKIKMTYVRVLDLEDALGVTNDDLKHIVEVFPRLKFLSLRGCKLINRLPKSLGSLRQLQTLDVRYTSVATLPKAILKLQRLQCVRAGTIHSAPWDEGGIMVLYQTGSPQENISTPVPAQGGATFAAAPLAPAEDGAATVVKAPSAPAEDVTTVGATPSEDTTTIETAPLSAAEVAITVGAAPLAPEEDATIGKTAPLAIEEDPTIVGADPTALVEDATIVAAPLSTPAQDTTSLAADPTAPVDTTIVAAALSTQVEDATIIAVARSAPAEDVAAVAAAPTAPAEDRTMVAASPLAPVEDATTISPAQADESSTAAAAPRSRPHALAPSWLSKLHCRSSLDNTNNGVDVPTGIGKLTTLQTFGVANVGRGNKTVILKELHKLTQLRRLSVCGITLDNIREFFSAIACLNHLQLLSVRLDKNVDGLFPSLDESFARPPKSLFECLKLQGHVRILPSSWIKEFADVIQLDLEITLQGQDDMQVILDHLKHRTNGSMKRLCIKPIHDGELRIGINDERFVGLRLEALEIVCTTNLQATIGNIGDADVLRVECSSGSSLQLSGLQGIRSLREVWLKGSCSDALKEDLQRQLAQRNGKYKPVLKVLQPRPS